MISTLTDQIRDMMSKLIAALLASTGALATLGAAVSACGAALLFTFDDRALVESVSAEARSRTIDGQSVPTPWRGRFWNYAERGGMLVPLDGEVAWCLPDGEMPYWRGHVTELEICEDRR